MLTRCSHAWQFVELQDEYMAVSEHIVSYIKSTPALLQASHATKLQENPGFALILGLGYNEAQARPPPQPVSHLSLLGGHQARGPCPEARHVVCRV